MLDSICKTLLLRNIATDTVFVHFSKLSQSRRKIRIINNNTPVVMLSTVLSSVFNTS